MLYNINFYHYKCFDVKCNLNIFDILKGETENPKQSKKWKPKNLRVGNELFRLQI